MDDEPFLLVESEDLTTIFSPLKLAGRIKYTCFSVSNSFLIFGATSGGIYLFRREPCCFLHVLPNTEGSVTHVSVSPDERLIAFSTIKGIVGIIERSHNSKYFSATSEHQNEEITCLQWNDENNELYVGDTSGKVSIITISFFPSKTIFQTPCLILMQLDSKIVQMDFNSKMLLVSTLTKCYICDTSKEIFRQVGHKLRDGEYGACIFNTHFGSDVISDPDKLENEKNSEYSNLSHLKLLCARPGSRVWEVAIDGTVISTHHFKEALAVPPRKIYFLKDSIKQNFENSSVLKSSSSSNGKPINFTVAEQSFNFKKLCILLSKFFFTFKSDGIYIFDPIKTSVVLWNNEITDIVDVKCVSDVIYVWSGCGKVYALNFVSLEQFLVRLYFQKKYFDLAKCCFEYENFLLVKADMYDKLYILHDLDEKLKSHGSLEKFCDRLKPFIIKCKEKAQAIKSQNALKLKSGICLVNNNEFMLLNAKQEYNEIKKPLGSNYLTFKGRSHVFPERFRNGELMPSENTISSSELKNSVVHVTETVDIVKDKKDDEMPRINIEALKKICDVITSSSKLSNDLVFNLFDQIVRPFLNSKLNSWNFQSFQPIEFDSILDKKFVQLITDLFHSSLESKILFEWLDNFEGDCVTNVLKVYPGFLKKNHSTASLELDFKLSKILVLFSNILRENQIIDLLKKTKMECFYESFLKVLEIYQDSSIPFFSVSNLNLVNAVSIPKMLNIAYFLMNVGQIDQCSKYSHKIGIQEMFYLVLKLQENLLKSDKSEEIIELQCQTLFLSYLDKSHRTKELMNFCNYSIQNYVIDCLENVSRSVNCLKKSNCNCRFPFPRIQSSIKMFPNVGYSLIDKMWLEYPEQCYEICSRIPYLWKYLIFIRRRDPLDDVLPLILQFGDIKELEIRSDELNIKLLEQSIKYLIKLNKGFCLNCNSKVKRDNNILTWVEFGLLCVKILGSKETLELFEKYEANISSRELQQVFYQGLIFSYIMETHNKGLKKNVVNLFNCIGKYEENKMSVFSEKRKNEILGPNFREEFNFQSNNANFHHWGVKVNFQENCRSCSLPLNSKILISKAGIVIFKCAHAFHFSCLRNIYEECSLCKRKTID